MSVHYITRYCSYAVTFNPVSLSALLVVEVVPGKGELDWKTRAFFRPAEVGKAIEHADFLEEHAIEHDSEPG